MIHKISATVPLNRQSGACLNTYVFIKGVFPFFELFCAHLASKFAICVYKTPTKLFLTKVKKVALNAEFHADFKTVEQFAKNLH